MTWSGKFVLLTVKPIVQSWRPAQSAWLLRFQILPSHSSETLDRKQRYCSAAWMVVGASIKATLRFSKIAVQCIWDQTARHEHHRPVTTVQQ